MAINTTELKVGASEAIIAASKAITPLAFFAKNYADIPSGAKAINVPVISLSAAGDFAEGTNDYGTTGEDGVTGVDVVCNKHLIKTVSVRPEEILDGSLANVDYFRAYGEAIGKTVGRAAVTYALGLVNPTNVSLSATFGTTQAKSKEALADLRGIAEDMGADPSECVVVLRNTLYNKMLGILDYSVIGPESRNSIIEGHCKSLFGFFGIVSSNDLPDGINGFVAHREALATVSRPAQIMVDNGAGEWGTIHDDVTGLALNFYKNQDWKTQRIYMSGDCMFGATIVQADKITRLV